MTSRFRVITESASAVVVLGFQTSVLRLHVEVIVADSHDVFDSIHPFLIICDV